MTATGLPPAVESTRLAELSDRSWREPMATGDQTAAASASVPSVSHLVALAPFVGTATLRHGHTGPGDSATFTVTGASGSGTVEDRYIGLVGGVLCNSRASNASETWSYPDVHGDIVASANSAGVSTGPFAYSPFGEAAPAGLPNNMNGDYEFGWLGQHQRGTEQAKNIHTVEMGARQYVPGLGRFLEVDPVEGGSANDYDYVEGNPVDNFDLAGEYCLTGKNRNGTCRSISRGAGRNLRGAGRGAVKAAKRTPGLIGRNIVRPYLSFQAGVYVFAWTSNIGFLLGFVIGGIPGAFIGLAIGGGAGLYLGRKASKWADNQIRKIPGFR